MTFGQGALLYSRYKNGTIDLQKPCPHLVLEPKAQDGDFLNSGDIAFLLHGQTQKILTLERLILNVMQRMSGIATLTRQLVQLIQSTPCQLMDTRKTTPNFRFPEKWAVRIGGGINHRMGLYDALLIKDNHVRALGSLTQALKRCEKYRIDQNLALPLIVEVQSLKEVAEVVKFNFIDRILLDNMLPFTIIKALDLVAHQCPCEASGNITAKNILAYAQTGVSCVSLGALTYAAKAIDLSLKFR